MAFVSTSADGVPRAGVTSVGLLLRTTLPVPVELVTPVPPRATESVPVVPATMGRPVAFVSVRAEGVPRLGVTRVGESLSTFEPLPVEVATPVPPRVTASRASLDSTPEPSLMMTWFAVPPAILVRAMAAAASISALTMVL